MTEYTFLVRNSRILEQFNTGLITLAECSIKTRALIKQYIADNL